VNARRLPLPSLGCLYYLAMAVALYIPIGVLVLFSFNDSSTLIFPLKGLTLHWYADLLRAGELLKALRNSLLLGGGSALVATILGALAAIGITRFNFPGRGAFLAVASLPLVIPYVVLAVGLLLFFESLNVPLSLWTVGVGHAVISLPYAMLIIAARLAGFEANLEEAAQDLGSSYWGTLLRVTLPLSAPALVAAFLTSFTTSFDEFALAFFLTGTQNTLPVYLYSQLRFPTRLPLVITLAALVMVASIIVVLFSEWLRRTGTPAREQAAARSRPA
jgi:spermidine/putrescine transport system permease protein